MWQSLVFLSLNTGYYRPRRTVQEKWLSHALLKFGMLVRYVHKRVTRCTQINGFCVPAEVKFLLVLTL